MLSKNNDFINKINEKYHHYKEDILKINLGEELCNELSEGKKENLFNYQEFLYNYMKDLNNLSNQGKKIDNRGLLIFHGLGSGKTTSGIIISEACRDYKLNENEEHYKTKENYKRKVILMIPANLFFDPWVKEISSKCYSNCEIRDDINKILKNNKEKSEAQLKDLILKKLKEHDFYVINYNAYTLNGGYKDKLLDIPNRKGTTDKYTNKYSESINPFDDSVIVIDECHNLVNMITNKIKSGEKVELYEDLFYSNNSRVILLSGTPIINDPFEISIISNIIRGFLSDNKLVKFEDNYDNFNKMFLDSDNLNIINKNMLKRRLNGLISYNKGINESVFAKEVNESVYLPLSTNQQEGYKKAEKLSKEKMNDMNDRNHALFKRKASNVIFPDYIFNEKLLKSKKLTKNGKEININVIKNKNNLLDATITKDMEKIIINILDNDKKPLNIDNELHEISKKTYHIIKKIKESNGPVLVYSNFEGLYGIKFIEEALKQNGFMGYNSKSTGNTYMKWTGKERNKKYKDVFNSLENKNGELIKVFLMTSSGKEGINLLSVRQVHIMEPWWNNTLIKQVIGRARRICSHNHIEKSDFIDLRFKKELRVVNERLVNVFQYYSFIDLRNKEENKLSIKNEMKRRSIDYNMKKVADIKEKLEKQILEILKEISIDCDINYERNNEDIICYIDKINKDYFESWNVKDDEIKIIKKRYNKINIDNIIYIKDQFNNIYKIKDITTIDLKNIENNIIKIGKLVNEKIEYENNYYKNESLQKKENKKIVKNYIKKICNINKININQNADYYGNYDKNLILSLKTFDKVNIYSNDKNIEKIKELDNHLNIRKENEKLESKILVINGNYFDNLEEIVNNVNEPDIIIVTNIDSEIFLFNKNSFYKKTKCLIIFNRREKNDFYKIIKNIDMNIENKIQLVKDLQKMKIDSEEKLNKYLKNEKNLNDIFTILKLKLNISDEILFDIKNFNECMRMLIKDIKNSKEYKDIPRKYKKSKMKKNELCKTIEELN